MSGSPLTYGACLQGLLGIGNDDQIPLFSVDCSWPSGAKADFQVSSLPGCLDSRQLLYTRGRGGGDSGSFAAQGLACTHAQGRRTGTHPNPALRLQEVIARHSGLYDFPKLLTFLGPMQKEQPTLLLQHLIGKMVHTEVRLQPVRLLQLAAEPQQVCSKASECAWCHLQVDRAIHKIDNKGVLAANFAWICVSHTALGRGLPCSSACCTAS